MAKYTMKQILESYTPEKRNNTSFWARIFSRPLSYLITYLMINMGLSANAVSVMSIFVALAACVLIMMGNPISTIGVFLFLFWNVMDCVDGNIARVKHTASLKGDFFDAVSGYTAAAFIYLSVGVAAFREPGLLSGLGFWIIIIGATASLSDLLSRIIYQKFLVTQLKLTKDDGTGGDIESERKSGLKRIADKITRNMTYSSLFMPLLVISKFTHSFDILTVFYCIYSVLILIGTYVMFMEKASKEFN